MYMQTIKIKLSTATHAWRPHPRSYLENCRLPEFIVVSAYVCICNYIYIYMYMWLYIYIYINIYIYIYIEHIRAGRRYTIGASFIVSPSILYFEHRGSIAAVSCLHHTLDSRNCLRHFFRCLLRSWLTFFFILVAVFFATAFFLIHLLTNLIRTDATTQRDNFCC